jgi:hypothetical protein
MHGWSGVAAAALPPEFSGTAAIISLSLSLYIYIYMYIYIYILHIVELPL